MPTGITYTINILDNTKNVLTAISGNVEQLSNSIKGTNNFFEKMEEKLKEFGEKAFGTEQIGKSITALSETMHSAIAPGIALNSSLADFQALTGSTAQEVEKISDYARQAATTFGVDAASGVEAYKNILGELGPQLAKNQEALKNMGESVAILSKSLGGDQLAATQALTTAINQYSIDTNDATLTSEKMASFMNVMVAAAQEGSVEVPQISEALKQSGSVAKEAGLSFEELNAAIQVVGETGRKGAEGGVAVRNFLSELGRGRFQVKEVQEELAKYGISVDKIANKNLSLADRIRMLSPIMQDSALISKMFGKENMVTALKMLQSADAIDELKGKITDTQAAYQYADTIMGSYAEKQARITQYFDNLKISLFNATQNFMPYLEVMSKIVAGLGNLGASLLNIRNLFNLVKSIPLGVVLGRINRIGLAALQLPIKFLRAFRIINLATMANSAITTAWGFITQGVVRGLILPAIRTVSVAIMNIPILGWIAAAITGIVFLSKYLWEHSKKFREVIMGIWEVIKLVFGKIWEVIKSYLSLVWHIWQSVFGKIWDGLQAIGGAFAKVFNYVGAVFSKVFGNIATIFKKVFAWISEKLGIIFKPLAMLVAKIFGGDSAIGKAYAEGAQKGADSWDQEHKNKENDRGKKPENNILNAEKSSNLAKPMLHGNAKAVLAPSSNDKGGGIKSINIKMTNLVGTVKIVSNNFRESAEEMKRKVQAALIEAVNDAQLGM